MGLTLRTGVLHVGDGSDDSANVEAREPLGLLVLDVHSLDLGTARAFARERDHPLDGLGIALEHRLDGPVRAVGHPARHPARAGLAPGGVAEEHALYVAVDDHSLANAHA